MSRSIAFNRLLSGLALCAFVVGLALLVQQGQLLLFHRVIFEAMVLSIVLGAVLRSILPLPQRFQAGIDYAAKPLLELAVCLLGAGLSVEVLSLIGLRMVLVIICVVIVALGLGMLIGWLFKLPWRVAALIAAGNAICGNSAISAVAPVIHAKPQDVASSIAFTAILGVVMVLGLPLLGVWLEMSAQHYGAWAGLTVYAVPQVLAATEAAGDVAIQVGTTVKLTRVLMLGPVVLFFSLLMRPLTPADGPRPPLVPWFIVGFIALAAMRSFGLLPLQLLPLLAQSSKALSLLAMAALGLGVDVRLVAKAGCKLSVVVGLSMIALLILSFCLL